MAYTVEGLEKSRKQRFKPKNIFDLVLKEFIGLSDSMKILDLGCGTGFFTRIIAEQCKADITGMDISDELLEGAKRLAEEKQLNIKFEKGDITGIPYDDGTFDIVLCDIMLECFKDASVPIREMKRVCKAGGTVAAIEPCYQAGVEYYPGIDKEMRDLLMKFSRADRSFGLGPMLPHYFHQIGLNEIDMVSWFWGKIGYKDLEEESAEEILNDMQDNIDRIKQLIPRSKSLLQEEQFNIINFYEQRLKYLKQNPEELKNDMSIRGIPVFIVKGIK